MKRQQKCVCGHDKVDHVSRRYKLRKFGRCAGKIYPSICGCEGFLAVKPPPTPRRPAEL
jgi:hypothetical protein